MVRNYEADEDPTNLVHQRAESFELVGRKFSVFLLSLSQKHWRNFFPRCISPDPLGCTVLAAESVCLRSWRPVFPIFRNEMRLGTFVETLPPVTVWNQLRDRPLQ